MNQSAVECCSGKLDEFLGTHGKLAQYGSKLNRFFQHIDIKYIDFESLKDTEKQFVWESLEGDLLQLLEYG